MAEHDHVNFCFTVQTATEGGPRSDVRFTASTLDEVITNFCLSVSLDPKTATLHAWDSDFAEFFLCANLDDVPRNCSARIERGDSEPKIMILPEEDIMPPMSLTKAEAPADTGRWLTFHTCQNSKVKSPSKKQKEKEKDSKAPEQPTETYCHRVFLQPRSRLGAMDVLRLELTERMGLKGNILLRLWDSDFDEYAVIEDVARIPDQSSVTIGRGKALFSYFLSLVAWDEEQIAANVAADGVTTNCVFAEWDGVKTPSHTADGDSELPSPRWSSISMGSPPNISALGCSPGTIYNGSPTLGLAARRSPMMTSRLGSISVHVQQDHDATSNGPTHKTFEGTVLDGGGRIKSAGGTEYDSVLYFDRESRRLAGKVIPLDSNWQHWAYDQLLAAALSRGLEAKTAPTRAQLMRGIEAWEMRQIKGTHTGDTSDDDSSGSARNSTDSSNGPVAEPAYEHADTPLARDENNKKMLFAGGAALMKPRHLS